MMFCESCGAELKWETEQYGDYAGLNYPGMMNLVYLSKIKHPSNGCRFQEMKIGWRNP